jgi:hypothetical protein
VLIESLVSELAIYALAKGILAWFTWLNKAELHCRLFTQKKSLYL